MTKRGAPRTGKHAAVKEEEKQPEEQERWELLEKRGGVRGSPQLRTQPGLGADAGCLAVCAFPYLLAFTTDSMEIRLVVNGNLVHTAVVPQLQLVASRVSRTGVLFLAEGLWVPPAPRGFSA